MDNRCQVAPDLRKRMGSIGGTEKECLEQPNSCWDPRPTGDAPSCYHDNSTDQCQDFIGCDKPINMQCFNQLWSELGCSTKPPEFTHPFSGRGYDDVVKRIKGYSKSDDPHKFKTCFGGGGNVISYCTSVKPKTCPNIDDKGTIIKCETCKRHYPDEGGVWLYKDGHRISIPHCQCPSATRAAELKNALEDNVCGHPVRVPKSMTNYVPKEESCSAAYAKCSTTEDCCPGYQCRQGDKRCLTDDQFRQAAFRAKEDRDPTLITKTPPIIRIVDGYQYHLITEAGDTLYYYNGRYSLSPKNRTQYLTAWTLNKSSGFSTNDVWKLRAGSHQLGLGFMSLNTSGQEIDWQLIKQGDGPETNSYLIQCKFQGTLLVASVNEVYVSGGLTDVQGTIYHKSTQSGLGVKWERAAQGSWAKITASGKDYVWGADGGQGRIWWFKKGGGINQSNQVFPGNYTASWLTADEEYVWHIGVQGKNVPGTSGRVYRHSVDPNDGKDWDEFEINARLSYITATGKDYLYATNSNNSIWVADKTGSYAGQWTQISGKGDLISADRNNFVFCRGLADAHGTLYFVKIDSTRTPVGGWTEISSRSSISNFSIKHITSLDVSDPNWIWATYHHSQHGSRDKSTERLIIRAKKPSLTPGATISLQWEADGSIPGSGQLGNVSYDPQAGKGGTCPSSNPTPYDGNGVHGSYCCASSVSSSGIYGASIDKCNGGAVACENPPCASSNAKQLVLNKYLTADNGKLILVDSDKNATKWTFMPKDLSKFIHQNADQPSDCDLVKAWYDPNVSWFYGGSKKVPGIKSDGEIFYTTDDKVVVVPANQCEVHCNSERFNICQQMNHKIQNCETNPEKCHDAVTTQKQNPFQPTNVDPDCFYKIPILNADGSKRVLHHGKATTTIDSLKCSSASFYNPSSADAAFPLTSDSNIYLILIKGDLLYMFKPASEDTSSNPVFTLQSSYPQPFKNVLGANLPSKLDASVLAYSPVQINNLTSKGLSGIYKNMVSSKVVLFRKDTYYLWCAVANAVVSQGSISSTWLNVPSDIDAAIWIPVSASKNQLCFFRSTMVYVVNTLTLVSLAPAYSGTQDCLYLLDGSFDKNSGEDTDKRYAVTTQEEAKTICEQCNGRLASLGELRNYIHHTSVNAEYAAWTTDDAEYTYYIVQQQHTQEIIKCGGNSSYPCFGKGGVWCIADPKKFILAGIANPRPIASKFPGCPDYLDAAICYQIGRKYQVRLFKGNTLYDMNTDNLSVSVAPHKIAPNLFRGLPDNKNPIQDNMKSLCKMQHKLQSEYSNKKLKYEGSTEIMRNGYDNLIKSKNMLKQLTLDMASNDERLHRLDESSNMLNRQTTNSQYANAYKDGYVNSLKLFLCALLICLFLALLRGTGKVGWLKGGKFTFIIIFIVLLTILIIVATLWKKLYSNSNMRVGLINWPSPPQHESDDPPTQPGGGDNTDLCNKLRAEELKLREEKEQLDDKGFNKFTGQKVEADGINVLTTNGKYQGQLLSDITSAKSVAMKLSKCDGMMIRAGQKYYDLFTLKTKLSEVIQPDANSIIYIKNTCVLGDIKVNATSTITSTTGTDSAVGSNNNLDISTHDRQAMNQVANVKSHNNKKQHTGLFGAALAGLDKFGEAAVADTEIAAKGAAVGLKRGGACNWPRD